MIESSKKEQKNRIVSTNEKEIDKTKISNILRPIKLKDYVGQDSIKKHLSVSIESSKIRKQPVEHILFYGPPGL
jgi:Holliday junction DNA helicase RuvB